MDNKRLLYIGIFLMGLAGLVIFDQWRTHGALYDLKEVVNHEMVAAVLFALGLPCLILSAKR